MTPGGIDPAQRIPVALLTGFLGSGKTSLLNRWLADPALADAAVVVNELGEIGIDHALIASSSDNTIELSTGCLCCTVSGDLVDTLRDLYVRRARGEIRAFSRVLVETTGMADPGPVVQVLMTQPVATRYRLCDVISTVDAVNGEGTLDRHPEAIKQVAVADQVVLTKVDLAAEAARVSALERCRRLNPAAEIFQSTPQSCPSVADVLRDRGYVPRMNAAQAARWLDLAAFEGDGPAPGYLGQRRHRGARHDARIRSFALRLDQPIAWEHLAAWLDALTMAHPEQLLRVKGIFAVQGRRRPLAVHAVQSLFHPPTELEDWPDDDRSSRVVFITQDLSREYVEEVLAVIRSRPPAASAVSPHLEQ